METATMRKEERKRITSEEAREIIDMCLESEMFIETAMAYYEAHLNKSATIYFLKNETTNLIKIGYTKKNLENRINVIKSNFNSVRQPAKLKLVKSLAVPPEFAREAEKELHRHFNCKRRYGEWFAISLKDIDDYYESESIDDNDFLTEYPNYAFNIRKYGMAEINRLLNFDMKLLFYMINEDYALIKTLNKIGEICSWAISVNLEVYSYEAYGERLICSWGREK